MMLASVYSFRVRPDRWQEFLAIAADGREILKRLGARVRLFRTTIGGDLSSVLCTVELEDAESFGAFLGRLQSDTEWRSWAAKVRGTPDPAAELTATRLLTEL